MRKAENDGPESLRGFMAKHLNVEVGVNLRSDRWTGADVWEAHGDPTITFESLLKRCEVVAVGLDGGGNDDLFGFTAVSRETSTGLLLSWSRAWALPIVLERRKDIAPRLLDFQKDGDLQIVDKIEDACDAAVALISHLPQLTATALSGLLGAPPPPWAGCSSNFTLIPAH